MKTEKIVVGRTYPYVSKANQGRGKVLEVYSRATGDWVRLQDNQRGAEVTVRPSQVGVR